MTSDNNNPLIPLFMGGLSGFIAERIPPLAGYLTPGIAILIGIAVVWALRRPLPEWHFIACITSRQAFAKRLAFAALWGFAIFITCTVINIPCTLIASHFSLMEPANPLLDASKSMEWQTIPLAALSLCVISPIAEELFFRRLLTHALQSFNVAEFLSYIIAALIFAAIHLQPAAFAGLFAGGLLFTWQMKKHDLIQAILCHGFYNAYVLLIVICIKLTIKNGG